MRATRRGVRPDDVAATRPNLYAAPPASARWASAAVRSGRSVAPRRVLPPPSRSRSGVDGLEAFIGVSAPEPAVRRGRILMSWSLWIWTKVQLHSKRLLARRRDRAHRVVEVAEDATHNARSWRRSRISERLARAGLPVRERRSMLNRQDGRRRSGSLARPAAAQVTCDDDGYGKTRSKAKVEQDGPDGTTRSSSTTAARRPTWSARAAGGCAPPPGCGRRPDRARAAVGEASRASPLRRGRRAGWLGRSARRLHRCARGRAFERRLGAGNFVRKGARRRRERRVGTSWWRETRWRTTPSRRDNRRCPRRIR